MDSTTQTTVIRDAVGAGVMSPNEGRSKLDLKPVTGGESPYLQQQNFSLAALAKRDAQADPFAPQTPPAPPPAANDDAPEDAPADEEKLVSISRMFTHELKSAAGFPSLPPTEDEDNIIDLADIFARELKGAARLSHGSQ